MATVEQLKKDLDSSHGLRDIIDILKAAALLQFRGFQEKEGAPQLEFFKKLESSLHLIFAKGVRHPLCFDRKSLPTLVVVITSDEGFLGELNTILVNSAVDLMKNPKDKITVLGGRGARDLKDLGFGFTEKPGITDQITYQEIEDIRDEIWQGYLKNFGRVYLIYPKFFSIGVQRVQRQLILPYLIENQQKEKPRGFFFDEMLLEPSNAATLEAAIFLLLGYKLLEIFWTSKQSEYAARIMHLEGSSQELSDLTRKRSFEYYQKIHMLKDKSIREISASKRMLKKNYDRK